MDLPVDPPILPMLAKRVGELPVGGTWIYEPKWDGFRALVFRDGDEILIQSRDEKSLNRYFPELLEPLRSQLPSRCVLDGEIVVARNGALHFDAQPRSRGTLRTASLTVALSLRARRRNRRCKEWRARLRCSAAPHSSRRVAGEASFTRNPRIDRALDPQSVV